MYNPFAKTKKEDIYSSQPSFMTNPLLNRSGSSNQSIQMSKSNPLQTQLRGIINKPTEGVQYGSRSFQAPAPKQPQGPVYSGPRDNSASQPQAQQTSQQPSYITNYKDLAAKKKEQAAGRKEREKQYYADSFAEKNRVLSESIPRLQEQFGQTQGYFQKGLANAQQRADIQKQNVTDDIGTLQRQAAQTRQESAARTGQMFAGLNTSDSYGFGSHGQAQENIESEFNRFTQENLRSGQNQKFEIDSALQEYEIDAQQKLDTAKMQLEDVISQIESDMRMNSIEKQNALDGVLADYEEVLTGIDSEMNGVYERYYTQLEEIGKNSLSEEFMTTGKPQNEADFKMMYENPDKYEEFFNQSGASDNENKALKMVNNLIDGNYQAVSGTFKTPGFMSAMIPGAAAARADIDGLKSLLSLAKRGELKGSGQVSDFETRMLEKAALAGLTPELPEDEFLKRLGSLREDLMSGGAVDQTARKIRVIGPTGEVGNIDESELQEAEQNGWRRA